ncbi:glutathionyl-hydroquinone reductase YqjG [Phoenix dactylifera]|uniref:Glutathionyl-hydroquinone reductase YqjG n=1 Tax=Phoenix dactylifera TaxID=42345 RepID=A0A8B7CCL9_PHODC|nr:glutathionyl-hydroquinone reductase YqjG [Phoenix dactylifera]
MWTSACSLFLGTTLPLHRGSRGIPEGRALPRARMSSSSSAATDPLAAVGRLLWGRSLPPGPLVSTVRFTWSAAWHLMMRQLAPSDPAGSYSRPPGAFGSVPDRYRRNPSTARLHLYVALPCPWAHRTLIVRALRNLEPQIPVSVAAPGFDGSWEFPGGGGIDGRDLIPGPDRANGRRTLREVYGMRRGGYDGRATVPMLWDVESREVVCNESYDIIDFFNSAAFDGSSSLDLSPPELKREIEEWNRVIYSNVNNGVYRCGFAQSQEAYDVAVNELFTTLDMLESHLSASRYLCGDVLTLADVCLFTTLIRFDLVYNVLFKCTKKKLLEYHNLHGYTRDIYQIPKVAETCNLEAIMEGYYQTLFPLNPGNIRPVMPSACENQSLSEPHDRESLSSNGKHRQIHVSE